MIPFNRPSLIGFETDFIEQAVRSGVISGEGTFGKKCEQFLEELLGGNCKVLLTPSCTAALEISAMLLDLKPGDEVIVPSFTFVSTASAFALRGAKLVFADIDPIFLNIKPESIRSVITPNTKAIAIVHYGGVACKLNEIRAIASERNVRLIEDAAHGLGSRFNGKFLGTFGELGTFSFHETKNITCGEGGALVINDNSLVDRAFILRDKGTNRRSFQRGDAPFYTWVDLGSSYVMSDVLAAFLFAQLQKFELINQRRRQIHALYAEGLRGLREEGFITFPDIPNPEDSSGHLFFILANSTAEREALQSFLKAKDILAVFHYQPLHRSAFVEKTWGKQPPLPITETIAGRLLRLPMFYSLTDGEVNLIVSHIKRFFCGPK